MSSQTSHYSSSQIAAGPSSAKDLIPDADYLERVMSHLQLDNKPRPTRLTNRFLKNFSRLSQNQEAPTTKHLRKIQNTKSSNYQSTYTNQPVNLQIDQQQRRRIEIDSEILKSQSCLSPQGQKRDTLVKSPPSSQGRYQHSRFMGKHRAKSLMQFS